ncbi:hypothetical protein DdX_09591 [Ditylenchus destructor]|uniref:Uncharacterized protein n=1 Tax=Ditylenchus destructor TaxID=166010 RepID=A0AAD4N5S2_9BILA|nr:hypothetical protein DdX_09591 [Ditylenchus destructor]
MCCFKKRQKEKIPEKPNVPSTITPKAVDTAENECLREMNKRYKEQVVPLAAEDDTQGSDNTPKPKKQFAERAQEIKQRGPVTGNARKGYITAEQLCSMSNFTKTLTAKETEATHVSRKDQ